MVLNKNSYFRSLMLIVMITSLLTPYSVLAQTNTEEKKVDYSKYNFEKKIDFI